MSSSRPSTWKEEEEEEEEGGDEEEVYGFRRGRKRSAISEAEEMRTLKIRLKNAEARITTYQAKTQQSPEIP